jgi:two-component system response regulator FixJ
MVAQQQQQQYVFLVDDDQDMRESIRSLLRSVGLPLESYSTAQEFLEKFDPEKPGCLVLDVRMPGMSGLDLQQRLRDRGIDLPIIIISGHADVSIAVRAIKAGAVDLIEKPFNDQLLLDRIHQALEENTRREHHKVESAEVLTRMAELTPREKEVLDKVVSGMTNKNIAIELGISRKTLDIHRSKVLQKMKAESIADLVRMVLHQRGYGVNAGRY